MATGTLIGLGIGALAVGAASTVAAGVLNKSAQSEANATNIQLSREQMAYQTSEREAAQEYNTPANQRARYEAAGINPFLALGNIDSGNTQMQTGVSPATVQPENALAQMVQQLGQTPTQALNVVQMAQQVQGMQEANEQAHTQTLYQERQIIQGMRESMARTSEALSKVSVNSAEYHRLNKVLLQQDQELKMAQLNYQYQSDYLRARNKREKIWLI